MYRNKLKIDIDNSKTDIELFVFFCLYKSSQIFVSKMKYSLLRVKPLSNYLI